PLVRHTRSDGSLIAIDLLDTHARKATAESHCPPHRKLGSLVNPVEQTFLSIFAGHSCPATFVRTRMSARDRQEDKNVRPTEFQPCPLLKLGWICTPPNRKIGSFPTAATSSSPSAASKKKTASAAGIESGHVVATTMQDSVLHGIYQRADSVGAVARRSARASHVPVLVCR